MNSINENEIDQVFKNLQYYIMGDSSEPYSDKVLSYAYDPVNIGEIKNADVKGFVKGDCGDSIIMYIKLKKDKINQACFLVDGCGASVASGCAVTELAKGKTPCEASKITPQEAIRFLDGMPASHIHCVVMAVQALQKALNHLNNSHKS
jgi:nitrogen fixation NifU-like protein